ncbi:MAG: ATP-dependent DNA helicase [Opitutales bacterium]|nr:ATP-dependent DNA helicase [Opitutales bacterium]
MIGFNENGLTGLSIQERIDSVDRIFRTDGFLQSQLSFEHRPEQYQMAIRVGQSLLSNESLLFEAGTGVGKSLAYLLPGIMKAVDDERKLIVSSHTISLQEQLLHKDLETCRKLFGQVEELKKYRDFKACLLIGKGNYLCTHRLSRALRDKQSLFEDSATKELERILRWSRETKTGIVQELYPQPSAEVWEMVNADSAQCNKRNCSGSSCFYQKAKEAVSQAQVLVVNHALLFALLGAGMRPSSETPGILFPNDFVVLDEAHTVPDIATEHFGLGISQVGLRRLMLQLFNPKTGKGLLVRYGGHRMQGEIVSILEESDMFFQELRLRYLEKRSIVRMHKPEWAEDVLMLPLQRLTEMMGDLASRITDETSVEEIKDYRRRIAAYKEGITGAIQLVEDDHVYWLESSGKKKPQVKIRSAPIDVAPYLKQHLFQRKTSCVMTSATLRDSEGMDRFAGKTGAGGTEAEAVDSPFEYEQQMAINIASDCPPLNPNDKGMEIEFLWKSILFAASKVEGGTMALFTSYREMNLVADKISVPLQKEGRPCYVQGEGASRSQLVEQFKKAGNALLLGTDSFWTGVDIPGAALSQVIIVRLPFENPSHPVLEARSEACEARGEKPFFSLTLPAAQIKFRQGIGRLIRNQTDSGVLTILDSRIVKKSYGRAFLDMLPHQNVQLFTQLNRKEKFLSNPSK